MAINKETLASGEKMNETEIAALAETLQGADAKRIEWWKRVANLLENTKISLAELKKSAGLDNARIKWWKRVADKKLD